LFHVTDGASATSPRELHGGSAAGELVVAVVAADEVALRRTTAVLREHGVAVEWQLAEPGEVASVTGAAELDAVVLACGSSATARAEAVRSVRRQLPETGIVLVTPPDSRSGVRGALEAGADGLVFDSRIEPSLLPTLRAVAAGQLAVPREARYQVDRPTLSRREKQTLALVVMGLTNAEIAARLYLAESTVKCHLSSSFMKLGVRSRHEATRLILDPEERLGLGILGLAEEQVPVPGPVGAEARR
jgi:DNA-binding NarL/FixJ family response regulator